MSVTHHDEIRTAGLPAARLVVGDLAVVCAAVAAEHGLVPAERLRAKEALIHGWPCAVHVCQCMHTTVLTSGTFGE